MNVLSTIGRGEGAITILGLAFLLSGCAKPCPDSWRTQHASRLDSLCDQRLPSKGRIWFEGPSGGACWCPCADLLAMSQTERDALVRTRRKADSLYFQQEASLLSLPPVLKVDTPAKKYPHIHHAGLFPLQAGQASMIECDRDDREIPFNGSCKTVQWIKDQIFDLYPVFKTVYTDQGDWFPSCTDYDDVEEWVDEDGTVVTAMRMRIELPDEFLGHPNVGGELLAFMILHEIGHALSKEPRCGDQPDERWRCEGECDDWAATEGLERVFEEDEDELIRISKAAEEQLGQYYEALTDADASFEAQCGDTGGCACDENACSYPPLDCRLKTIEASRKVDQRRPACVRNWPEHVPDGCETCS